jgi:hypothetical protein
MKQTCAGNTHARRQSSRFFVSFGVVNMLASKFVSPL